MSDNPVVRTTLGLHRLPEPLAVDTVEVRRITIRADVHPGAHWHNGPVFGVIETGSVFFQVEGEDESVLHAGDTFYEPGNRTITRFDATGEGVTFLGWFPMSAGTEPELTMGERGA